MSQIALYADSSKNSAEIINALNERQIKFRLIKDAFSQRSLPALETGNYLYEGRLNIKVYFLSKLGENGLSHIAFRSEKVTGRTSFATKSRTARRRARV